MIRKLDPKPQQKSAACQAKGAADLFLLQRISQDSILSPMNTLTKFAVTFGAVSVVLAALPAAAQEKGNNAALSATALSCMQTATDVRDNAIIAAWDVQYPAIKTALQTRQASLKAAWTQTDAKTRRAATKAAWNAYKKSAKSARAAMKASHKAAWTKFEADKKACSPKATKDDNGSAGMDNQL